MKSTLLFTRPELTSHPTDLSAIWKPQRGPQLFDTYSEPTTCLSTEPHEQAVKDPVQHYFGCIEICERPNFFNQETNHVWINEREIERKKLKMERGDAYRLLSPSEVEALLDVPMRKRMISVAVAIEARYKRTEVMRRAMMKPPSSGGQPGLVANVDKSRNKWMNSQKFKEGIPAVREWRRGARGGHPLIDQFSDGDPAISERVQTGRREVQRFIDLHGINDYRKLVPQDLEYSIERDVYAHLIEFTFQQAPIQTLPGAGASTGVRQLLKPTNNELLDVGVKGTFPDQRISMSRLLNDGKDLKKEQCNPHDNWNILRQDRNEGTARPRKIQYFHIPSNNMAVRAISSTSRAQKHH